MRHDALAIPYKLDPQPIKAGKSGFRLRDKLYLPPSLEFGEQGSVRNGDFDHSGVGPVSPGVQLLVGTGVFRQDLGRDLYFGLLSVGRRADPVLEAVVTLVADGLKQVGIRHQLRAECHCPRAGIHLRIVERDFNFHVAEIPAPVAFSHAQRLRVGMTIAIQPRPVIESEALYHQRVSLPAPHRISHPARIRVGLQCTPVHENLTIGEIFVQHQDQTWGLNDFRLTRAGAVARTPRQALDTWGIFLQVFRTLLD